MLGVVLTLGIVSVAPGGAVAASDSGSGSGATGRLTFTHDLANYEQTTGMYAVRSDALFEPITFGHGWVSFEDGGPFDWSPDGTRVATARFNGSRHDIFVMGADGRGAKNLTASCSRDWSPSWSPDGRQIAFITEPCNTPLSDYFEIWVMNADGSDARPIYGIDERLDRVDWSPDGQKLLVSPYGMVLSPDGTELQTRLSLNGATARNVKDAAWSPDGRRFVFQGEVCTQNPSACTEGLHVTNSDGSAWRFLGGTDVYQDTWATWSPDGTRITFSAHDPDNYSSKRLFEVPVAGGQPQAIVRLGNRDTNEEYPAWQPCPTGECPGEKPAARTIVVVRCAICTYGFFVSDKQRVTLRAAMFKKRNGRWVKFSTSRMVTKPDRHDPLLSRWDMGGDSHQSGDPCPFKLVVRYGGDETHQPSRFSETIREC